MTTGAYYLAMMMGAWAIGVLAFSLVIADMGHRRRRRDLARQLYDIGAITLEESIAAAPHWQYFLSRMWRYCDVWSMVFRAGKNWGAGEGEVLYRLNVELFFAPPSMTRNSTWLVVHGPFDADSGSWTGHRTWPSDAYVIRPWRRLHLNCRFYR